jgi:hypothetical protein
VRLTSARIRGFGRLVDTSVNLDAKLIAVVGPNEAGKSTLLEALAHLHSDEEVPVSRRSRGAVGVTDESQGIRATFQLDEEDKAALGDLGLDEKPVRATIARSMSGKSVHIDLEPTPRKRRAPVELAAAVLRDTLATQPKLAFIDDDTTWGAGNGDPERNFLDDLRGLLDAVEDLLAVGSDGLDEEHIERVRGMSAALDPHQDDSVEFRHVLDGLAAWAEASSPASAARDVIWNRIPPVLLFGEKDRSLRSSYAFDEDLAREASGALANLAQTAGLDLAQLYEFHSDGDLTRRQTALNVANRHLRVFFEEAWRQSRLSVQFNLDGDLLRIQLEEDNGVITVFDERSAGLRMFIALACFLATRGSELPPILLIDEAENHLHLDAQADLVNMFVVQEQAAKIVYTTHSPGCLPPDLGTGIRSVVPSAGSDRSDVRNSFWQGAAGYSPLLMAMGAAAAAFTPTRRVVLAEGAADMVLYPTLIRAATDLQEIPYQIAPGLAEVSRELVSDLDLEAAKVTYLVDKDAGGRKLKKTLLESGVPENLIIMAGAPGVEALVDPGSLRAAFSALLVECNVGVGIDESAIPGVPDGTKTLDETLRAWAGGSGLTVPGKVAVGNWLVQNSRATSTPPQRELLRELHEHLMRALA